MKHGRYKFALVVQLLCAAALLLHIPQWSSAATHTHGVADSSSHHQAMMSSCHGNHQGASVILHQGNKTGESSDCTKEQCRCLHCTMSGCGSTTLDQPNNGLISLFGSLCIDLSQSLIPRQSVAHHDVVLAALFRPPTFLLN